MTPTSAKTSATAINSARMVATLRNPLGFSPVPWVMPLVMAPKKGTVPQDLRVIAAKWQRSSHDGALSDHGLIVNETRLSSYPHWRRWSVCNSLHSLQWHLKFLSSGIAKCPQLARVYIRTPTAFMGWNSSPETQ
jgi:hypothetical protein